MSRRTRKSLEHWLTLEQQNAPPEEVEQALEGLFRAFPQPRVPAEFTARVLHRAGLQDGETRHWLPFGLVAVWRSMLVLSLALAAVAAALLPGVVWPVAVQIRPGLLLGLGAEFLVTACQLMAEGLAVWNVFSSVGESVAAVTSSPQLMLALSSSVLLSIIAFYLLRGLMAGERRSGYVESA